MYKSTLSPRCRVAPADVVDVTRVAGPRALGQGDHAGRLKVGSSLHKETWDVRVQEHHRLLCTRMKLAEEFAWLKRRSFSSVGFNWSLFVARTLRNWPA